MTFSRPKTWLLVNSVAILLSASFAWADYSSGRELLAKYPEIVRSENGAIVEVPMNYDDPKSGRFPVYYYVVGKFDPARPSVLIFLGGPGQAAHFPPGHKIETYAKMPFNFIMMDQRGIGFSKPDSEADYNNPGFYASENTARDANEVRKALNIQKIVAYGGSYGTVPATLFGALFPEVTRAVVLEGTFFGGYEYYEKDPFLISLNSKLFHSLDSTNKKKVLEITAKNPITVSEILKAYVMPYGKRGLQLVKEWLEASADADDFLVKISQPAPSKESSIPKELAGDSMSHYILSCKELGIGREGLSITIIHKETGPEWFRGLGANWYINTCKNLGLGNLPPLPFEKLRVSVPVIYLQGQMDPATLTPLALSHFAIIPTGPKAFVQFDGFGHTPVGQYLRDGGKQQAEALLTDFLPKVFSGRTDLEAEARKLNELGGIKIRLK